MQGQNSFPAPPEILEPRFFLAPNSSKLCVATDTRSKPNHHRYTRDLVVGKAYAVRLRVEGSRCRVYLNDECVSDEQNLDASRVDGATAAVWVGDGMHNDGHGASLRNLLYTGLCDVTKKVAAPEVAAASYAWTRAVATRMALSPSGEEWQPCRKGTLHGECRVSADYEVAFELKVGCAHREWSSVLRFTTTGNNYGGLGDRTPAFFTGPQGFGGHDDAESLLSASRGARSH